MIWGDQWLDGGQGFQFGGTQYYGGHSPPGEVSSPLLGPCAPPKEFFPTVRAIYMLTIV